MNKLLRVFLFVCALVTLGCSAEKAQSIELKSEADLAGLRVAAIAGSSYEVDLSSRDDISLQRFNSIGDILQALVSDKVDVAIHDEVYFNADLRKENGIKIAMRGETGSPTAFLFRKHDPELVEACSSVIRRMEEDGTMQRLKDFWLTDKYAETGEYTHIQYEASGEPLRVATCVAIAPLSFIVDGEWYGLEVDILRELGKELGRPVEVKSHNTASGLLALATGMVDVACGCLFITPEREEMFAFSEPYHYFRPAYFVVDREAQKEKSGFAAWLKTIIHKNLIAEHRWRFITTGLWITLEISILAILLGSILGIGLYSMTRSRKKWVRSFPRVYKGILAGIPQLVLLLILFYVVFAKTGIPAEIVAVIAFAMYFASAACSIYTSSLDAIPRGQTEAGLALGFTRTQTFLNIVLPQAIIRGLPLYKHQCTSLIKGTSIVGYIAIQDITKAGDIIRSRTFDAVIPLLLVTVIYFLLVWLIGALLNLATPKKRVL